MIRNENNIKAEYETLRKTDKATLKEIYSRSYRVCDLRGVDKTTLIMGILEARHGSKRIEAAFANS